jgi:class 3 adenylate cyclase
VRSLVRVKAPHDELVRLRAAAPDVPAASSTAAVADEAHGGEREREVLCVRVEIRGLHARADARSLRLLRQATRDVTALAAEHGGEVERLHGDGAVVLFDAKRADASARALRFATAVLSRWREAMSAPDAAMADASLAAAIVLGSVFTGPMPGAGAVSMQAAVGPAMAAAAALVSRARAAELLVDAACAAAMADAASFQAVERGVASDAACSWVRPLA